MTARNRLGASARGTPRVPPPVPDDVDFYQTVEQDGVAFPQRSKLNFVQDFALTDNPGSDRTDVELASGVIPVADLVPGTNGQELKTVGGVAVWTFDADDFLLVANLTALAATDMALRGNSMTAYVQTVRAYYNYDSTSALTADGITVVTATGGGRWLRNSEPSLSWAYQATWFIDATNGNDENTGATSGAGATGPLKHWAELQRRIDTRFGAADLQQQTTVSFLGSVLEYCHLWYSMSESVAANARLIIRSDSTAVTIVVASSGGGISAVSAINRATGTQTRLTITDTNTPGLDFRNHIGKVIKLRAGSSSAGAWCVIQRATVATVAICTPMFAAINPATFDGVTIAAVTPIVGDNYDIVTYPSMYGHEIIGRKLSGAVTADRVVGVLYQMQIGPGSAGTSASAGQPIFDTNCGAGFDESTGVPNSQLSCVVQCLYRTQGYTGKQTSWTSCFGQPDSGNFALTGLIIAGGGVLGTCQTEARTVSAFPQFGADFCVEAGGGFSCEGPIVVSPNGISAWNSTGVGFNLTTAARGDARIYCSGAAVLYGSGNTTFGIDADTEHPVIYETNAPVVTGTTADARIGGQNMTYAGNVATNVPVPHYDPFKRTGIIQNSNTVPSSGSIKRTGIAAAVGATAFFSAAPQPGLYRAQGVIVITTNGTAGDTLSLTLAFTDTRGAETMAVPLTTAAGVTALIATAVGGANNEMLYFDVMFEVASGTPTYAIAFPTKTGAPVISFRMKVERLQ